MELRLDEAKMDDLDVEAVVGFAEQVLGDAGGLWREFDLDQRQRLQKALFPKGIVYQNGAFGTAETPPIYSVIPVMQAQTEGLAPRA